MATFELTSYVDIPLLIRDIEYAKSKHLIVKKHENLYIIKYIKSDLTPANIQSLGLFRSVITDGVRILSFSPPKSISIKSVAQKWGLEQLKLEEFVEGTMINCFYHDNQWKIAHVLSKTFNSGFKKGEMLDKPGFGFGLGGDYQDYTPMSTRDIVTAYNVPKKVTERYKQLEAEGKSKPEIERILRSEGLM